MQRHHAAAQAQEQQARLQAREQHRVRYGPEPPNAPEPYRVDQRLDQERWEVPDRYKIIRVIGTGSYGKTVFVVIVFVRGLVLFRNGKVVELSSFLVADSLK